MLNEEKDISEQVNERLQVNNLSDPSVLIIINEYAKTDMSALKLMTQLQASTDFGERDMILNRMLRYVKDKQCLAS